MQDKAKPSEKNHYHLAHVKLLVNSFKRFTGENILHDCNVIEDISREIYFAPFAVISHGTESDPVFNYANQRALGLFELSWDDLITLPSRTSAERDSQSERDRILKTVLDKGYVDDYSGVRISYKGKRFQVNNAIVWNLIDKECYCGQAALIRDWSYL